MDKARHLRLGDKVVVQGNKTTERRKKLQMGARWKIEMMMKKS